MICRLIEFIVLDNTNSTVFYAHDDVASREIDTQCNGGLCAVPT